MTKDLMRYDLLVERALRGVVRETLTRILADGLPGDHHLYITFRTQEADVALPGYLHEKYPTEMTIVLQHQYRDLAVDSDGFSVSLSFNDVHEVLRIPFAAITALADPSVNFSLQFKFDGESGAQSQAADTIVPTGKSASSGAENSANEPSASSDNIVTLDTFRKK